MINSIFISAQYVLVLCVALLQLSSTAPVASPAAKPISGMELYMGSLMAATLLAKGKFL